MKQLILLSLLLLCNLSKAQIGSTRESIIMTNGNNYESGKGTSTGVMYISYWKTATTEISGTYKYSRTFYFDEDNKCFSILLVEPAAEINSWVKLFNKQYVKIDEMIWKDYQTSITYKLEIRPLTDNVNVVLMRQLLDK